MNYFSSALKSALSNTPTLTFTIGEQVSQSSIWTIHSGILKADKSAVSVFMFDVQKNRDKLGLARNFLKRVKSIRHPTIPKYIEAVETDSQIIIGVEQLSSLAQQLERNIDKDFICLGLFNIAVCIINQSIQQFKI